jgi:hypothetical protein
MGNNISAVGDLLVPAVREDAAPPAQAERGSGRDQRGMVSAEWAVGIVAAVAIAGVLLAVVTSGPVEDNLLKFILKVIKYFVTVAGI